MNTNTHILVFTIAAKCVCNKRKALAGKLDR